MKQTQSTYVLETETEFERLEHQSTGRNYDFREELSNLKIKPKARILDAGCGSGIVSRFLAEIRPHAQVVGCDLSEVRIEQARKAGKDISNLSFKACSLDALDEKPSSFDLVVCRYVYQHLTSLQSKVTAELFRVLKPGSTICLVDADGFFLNLAPQTPLVKEVLEKISASGAVDFNAGRRLKPLLTEAGFQNIKEDEVKVECSGEDLTHESRLMVDRIENAKPLIERIAGSKQNADRFKKEYIATLNASGSTYRYKKFIVTATKPSHLKIVRSNQE